MFTHLLNQARRILGGRAPQSGLQWTGRFGFACPELGIHEFQWAKNRVVNQGLNHALNAALRGSDVISTWYVAPFVANITPVATITAANFDSTLTEFTNYTEAVRQTWTSDGAATSQVLVNSASPCVFTVDTGGQTSIYGAGLLSASAKNAVTGECFAAAKAPSPFLSLAAGFLVKIQYQITGTSS
jgi:hypothetical protein